MEPTSVYDAVIAVIREMGVEDTSLVRTVLMRDNRFVGRKYYYTGGYAICMAGSNVVEFYDDGKLLRTVQATEETGLAA
ncbi:MAG: hypothetical protein RBS80_30915 [Thermoguttaceae bacterium]|jgi:hypothetical protein|nr:hypothetical protein [Thermoguttaceae bacterium]